MSFAGSKASEDLFEQRGFSIYPTASNLCGDFAKANDAVFTALDVKNGVIDADDAWRGFAKKGASEVWQSPLQEA